MALNSTALQSWLLTHAAGVTEVAATILGYEPRLQIDYATAGGKAVLAGWLGRGTVAEGIGGLRRTAARVGWTLRLHRNAFEQDQAATERLTLDAIDGLTTAYFGDFEVDGIDAFFDPKGQYGDALNWEMGYIDLSKQLNRVATINLGIVVRDAWPETP